MTISEQSQHELLLAVSTIIFLILATGTGVPYTTPSVPAVISST